MLSFLARRIILRTPQLTSLAVSRSNASVCAFRSVTRTFVTAPVVAYPTRKATDSAVSTGKTSTTKTKKSTGKSSGTKSVTAKKPAAKPKKEVKPKKEAKPKKVVVRAEDMPPKRPATAYMLFYVKHQKSLPPIRSREDAVEAAKSASKMWASMTDMEKKPFSDERAELMTKYKEAKAKYDLSIDPAVLNEINRRRAARGQRAIRRQTKEKTRVLTAYFRFARDYRTRFMQDYKPQSGTENPIIALAKASGTKWKEMSDSEKAPYYEAYRLEKAEQAVKH